MNLFPLPGIANVTGPAIREGPSPFLRCHFYHLLIMASHNREKRKSLPRNTGTHPSLEDVQPPKKWKGRISVKRGHGGFLHMVDFCLCIGAVSLFLHSLSRNSQHRPSRSLFPPALGFLVLRLQVYTMPYFLSSIWRGVLSQHACEDWGSVLSLYLARLSGVSRCLNP